VDTCLFSRQIFQELFKIRRYSDCKQLKVELIACIDIYDSGSLSPVESYVSGCGLAKRLCGYPDPTVRNYHPQVYNFQQIFNIIAHEANYKSSNNRCPCQKSLPGKEILTPSAEQKDNSSQANPSAPLTASNFKKLQKY